MKIRNFSWNAGDTERKNSEFFPKNIKALIVGRTGCGKTNLLIHCLLCPNWLDYDHLYVYCTSMTQPEYKILKAVFEYGLTKEAVYALFENQDAIRKKGFEVEKLFEEMKELFPTGTKIKADFIEDGKDVPDPRTFSCRNKNLIIFDDVMLEKQNPIKAFYTGGRHHNINCFFLAQDFFTIERNSIRQNMNFLCLFDQPDDITNEVYRRYVKGDMPREEFLNFCKRCWDTPFNFVVIDLDRRKNEGRYRCNLDEFYIPLEFH